MDWTIALVLVAVGAQAQNYPATYLISVIDIPLNSGESIETFSIATWGVEFRTICKIPGGWRIKAGSSATPDGVLEGEGSQGATWFNLSSPPELRDLALITLHDEVQQFDVRGGPDATFKGFATISTAHGERKITLSSKNLRLVPARRCPAT